MEGSYLRLIDFVSLNSKKKEKDEACLRVEEASHRMDLLGPSNLRQKARRPLCYKKKGFNILNLRTTTSQKCAAVPRRARIQGS